MAKSWNRLEVWLGLIVMGVGGVILGLAGLWIYVSATATPLHPDRVAVPSNIQGDPSQQWAEAVARGREIVRAEVSEQNLPGVSVAVGAAGEVVWAEGFGFTDLDTRVTVTPRTKFRIGTASTVLTAAAVGVLLEQGKLSLDDPIKKHLPEFGDQEWPLTLRQVMAHVGGIRSDSGDEGFLLSKRCERTIEGVQLIANDSLRFEPGTEFRFSNYGFILVSATIEAAAGEPFLAFMRTRVFEPLAMRDTMADFTGTPVPDKATSYFPRFAADPRYGPDPMREADYSCYAGAAAFVSTPSDLVRFALAMKSGALLQPATVELLQAEQRLASGQGTGYGLGWDIETVSLGGAETRVLGHDGDVLGGPVASLMTVAERGLAVAVISNTSYVNAAGIALKVADAFTIRQESR
jgi:CubicO group peptidase (beta-lactamase class C family)